MLGCLKNEPPTLLLDIDDSFAILATTADKDLQQLLQGDKLWGEDMLGWPNPVYIRDAIESLFRERDEQKRG
eukprot:10569554-Alexandrium_andersonii.AAC.1